MVTDLLFLDCRANSRKQASFFSQVMESSSKSRAPSTKSKMTLKLRTKGRVLLEVLNKRKKMKLRDIVLDV